MVFGSFLSWGASVFARLRRQMVLGFGAELLPRGLAAVAEPSLLFLLTISKPLLARAAIGLGLFNICPSLGETLTFCVSASEENWAPTSSLSLEGAPPSCLLEPQLLLPLLGHHTGCESLGKTKTPPHFIFSLSLRPPLPFREAQILLCLPPEAA